jgi:adenylate kinase
MLPCRPRILKLGFRRRYTLMKYRTILIFGAPGSGKGTQGKALGMLPGYFHCACGDVFRSLNANTELGKAFLEYSSRGELVPDEITIKLWHNRIKRAETAHEFDPERDFLVLDGIPRDVNQAKLMDEIIDLRTFFHLTCPDREKLMARLKSRALKDNRLDDANENVIRKRFDTYEEESKPLLEFYGHDSVVTIDATQSPARVLLEILKVVTRLEA